MNINILPSLRMRKWKFINIKGFHVITHYTIKGLGLKQFFSSVVHIALALEYSGSLLNAHMFKPRQYHSVRLCI